MKDGFQRSPFGNLVATIILIVVLVAAVEIKDGFMTPAEILIDPVGFIVDTFTSMRIDLHPDR